MSRQVAFTRMADGSAALLDLESSEYFALNGVGARIWSDLRDGRALPDIAGRLCAEFEVEPESAAATVTAFVHSLREADLLPPETRTGT